ncbi:peptidase S41, partial [Acinetobacter baumannii]
VQEVLDLVKSRYVDAVSLDSLNDLAINTVLSHLDPHSVYIPPSDITEVSEDLMGNFQGIGVEYEMIDDTINLSKIIKAGPAEKAGLKMGDK